jgi:hypothetical protein
MTTATLSSDPRLGIGSSVTPTDHRAGHSRGVIVGITGTWAQVCWSVPIQEETLEWVPALHAVPRSSAPDTSFAV